MKHNTGAQIARLRRARAMPREAVVRKIASHWRRLFSYRANVRRIAYGLSRHSVRLFGDRYEERPEYGPSNLEVKLSRLAQGGPFEPRDITLVNRAAVSLLGAVRNVLEIGSGTGMFASLAAEDPMRRITASEFDAATLDWARRNRPAANIDYCSRGLEDVDDNEYDLVVALEVVEHLRDYPAFLSELARVAPRAIISTPNKNRSAFASIAAQPAFEQHVREWTAGEFYWVLRVYYDDVRLYTLPDIHKQMAALAADHSYSPMVSSCSVYTHEAPLIAVCSDVRVSRNPDRGPSIRPSTSAV